MAKIIGNWIITENSIETQILGGVSGYTIANERLFSIQAIHDGSVYRELLSITEKDIKISDKYAFNTAFILAAIDWNITLDIEILQNTLKHQHLAIEEDINNPSSDELTLL